jgi:hypothetical protein
VFLLRSAVRWCVLVLVLAAVAPASASDEFDSSDAGSRGLMLVRSAELRTPGLAVVSLALDSCESLDLADELGAASGRHRTLRLAGSVGLTPWLELAADAAVVSAAWDGDDVTGLTNPAVSARLGAPLHSPWLHVALEGRTELPGGSMLSVRGTDDESVHLAGGSLDAAAMILATADLTSRLPLKVHVNAGWVFHRDEDNGRRLFPDSYPAMPEGGSWSDNDALLLRGAVEFPGRNVVLFTEFRGDVLVDRSLVALKENPLAVTPGVRVRLGAWSATAGLTVGLSGNDRSTPDFDPFEAYPDWEFVTSLSWGWAAFAADTDGDGVEDYRDSCPRTAEDRDGFLDRDGCPDPDNDGDGIADELDFEPVSPEDLDGFEDEDGSPDLDNDGDGIADRLDMCPNAAEDFDGFEDEDGCPDR